MFTISDSIFINAPIERCFLLSTNIELVGRTLGMKPIEGKLSGLVVADDRLVWAGWKFGFPQMHESYVTGYDPPSFFQDTMGRGRFKRYQHDHYFYEMNDRTVLNDKIRFTMPLGFARTARSPVYSRAVSLKTAAPAIEYVEAGGGEQQGVAEVPSRGTTNR